MKKQINLNKEDMAVGYMEMSNINLTIATEDFHLEQEGMKIYEMDRKETEGYAQGQ